ncbi:MAG: CheR family methyltransferase [Deltaproteobacteria bacterium]
MTGDVRAEASVEPDLSFWTVPVLAAEGGLDPLRTFLAHVPVGIGAAFIVYRHVAEGRASRLSGLLAQHLTLPIVDVEDGTTLEPDRVHVIPPDMTARVEGHRVRLEPVSAASADPMDVLLQSTAEAAGRRTIAFVLSGANARAQAGLRSVRAAGGKVCVQSPASSDYSNLPAATVRAELADSVHDPSELVTALLRAVADESPIARLVDEPHFGTDGLARLHDAVEAKTGLDFRWYASSALHTRVRRRLALLGCEDIDAYLDYVERFPSELDTLSKYLLVGVTRFFRDLDAWTALEEKVLRPLVATALDHSKIRVWVAACGTGEDAYSTAMLLDQLLRDRPTVDFQMFATDLDATALTVASHARYTDADVVGVVPDDIQKRYFEARGPGWVVRRGVRERITFARHNVVTDPPFARMDLIVCRNLLIYLDEKVQDEVRHRFEFGLHEQGYLFLGPGESLGVSAPQFSTLDARWRLHRGRAGRARKPSTKAPLKIAPLMRESYQAAAERTAQELAREVERAVLARFAPSCIAVDADLRLLHVFGDAGDRLAHPHGALHANLLEMLPPSVSARLANAAAVVERTGEPARIEDATHATRIELLDVGAEHPGFLVTFATDAVSTREPVLVEILEADRILQLETELAAQREQTRAAQEEAETLAQELVVTQQQLTRLDDETRAQVERTGALSEELFSVNADYQERVVEMTALESDLRAITLAAGIGFVVFDVELRLRRYHPGTSLVAHLVDSDLGVTLDDLAWHPAMRCLADDVRSVLKSRQRVRRRLDTPGQSYAVQIGCTFHDDRPSGVIVATSPIEEPDA